MAEKSMVKDGLKYSKDHEWVKLDGEKAKIGITDHAQHELTEVVYVELPKKGAKIQKGDVLGQVESVKTVASVYAPVSGEIVEVNSALENETEKINKSPYDDGWMAVLKLSNPDEVKELMDAAAYRKMLNE